MYLVNGIDLDGYERVIFALAPRYARRSHHRLSVGDCINEGWIALHCAALDYVDRGGEFGAFAYVAVSHALSGLLARIRDKQFRECELIFDPSPAKYSVISTAEDLESMRSKYVVLRKRMPRHERLALERHYLQGRSIAAIADEERLVQNVVYGWIRKYTPRSGTFAA